MSEAEETPPHLLIWDELVRLCAIFGASSDTWPLAFSTEEHTNEPAVPAFLDRPAAPGLRTVGHRAFLANEVKGSTRARCEGVRGFDQRLEKCPD